MRGSLTPTLRAVPLLFGTRPAALGLIFSALLVFAPAASSSNTDPESAKAQTEPLIDLVIVKDASSPTPLNGIVNYSLMVTNKGPDTATDVQLADGAPAGITFLTANPSQGTCNVSAALVTCSLGSIALGQTVTIAVTGRATVVDTLTNTATVTGSGGRETNPATNVDDAVTVVPRPLAAPEPVKCLVLGVRPRMIRADGKPDRIVVKVVAGNKPVARTKVTVFGAGVRTSRMSNADGLASLTVNPEKAGLLTITVLEGRAPVCSVKRVGVVAVFTAPLTG
jgi:uncharacterized repeat protein (TIGR01451 family)